MERKSAESSLKYKVYLRVNRFLSTKAQWPWVRSWTHWECRPLPQTSRTPSSAAPPAGSSSSTPHCSCTLGPQVLQKTPGQSSAAPSSAFGPLTEVGFSLLQLPVGGSEVSCDLRERPNECYSSILLNECNYSYEKRINECNSKHDKASRFSQTNAFFCS